MNNREIVELFEDWQVGVDMMNDAHQAQYDWDGNVPENEDVADWQKHKRIGAIRIG